MTIKYELLLPYPHMLYEEGIVFVWETAAMTFPGGFTDGGKTAKQKDLKSYLNHFYLYAKKRRSFKWPKKGAYFASKFFRLFPTIVTFYLLSPNNQSVREL